MRSEESGACSSSARHGAHTELVSVSGWTSGARSSSTRQGEAHTKEAGMSVYRGGRRKRLDA
jgi:hypothetical protein